MPTHGIVMPRLLLPQRKFFLLPPAPPAGKGERYGLSPLLLPLPTPRTTPLRVPQKLSFFHLPWASTSPRRAFQLPPGKAPPPRALPFFIAYSARRTAPRGARSALSHSIAYRVTALEGTLRQGAEEKQLGWRRHRRQTAPPADIGQTARKAIPRECLGKAHLWVMPNRSARTFGEVVPVGETSSRRACG